MLILFYKDHGRPESCWRMKRLGQGKSQETTETSRTSRKQGSGSGKEVWVPHTWGVLSSRECMLQGHLKALPQPGGHSKSNTTYTVCLAEDTAGRQLLGVLLPPPHTHVSAR